MASSFSLWVYLAQKPLLWLAVTLLAYAMADRLSEKAGRHPLLNPVLCSAALIGAVLVLTRTSYAVYFEGAQFVHFLLGPATVALAVPLYERRAMVRRALLPMIAALVTGAVVTLTSVFLLMSLFGAPRAILLSIMPKSVTAGIAMGVSESVGGDPALTAVLVIMTGILGAIIVTPMFDRLGLEDWRARGFSAGVNCHGIGTARAFQCSPVAGTFAAIGMALNAVLIAVVVPLVLQWWG